MYVFSLDPVGCGGYGHLAFVTSGLNPLPPAKRGACLFGNYPKRLKCVSALSDELAIPSGLELFGKN